MHLTYKKIFIDLNLTDTFCLHFGKKKTNLIKIYLALNYGKLTCNEYSTSLTLITVCRRCNVCAVLTCAVLMERAERNR